MSLGDLPGGQVLSIAYGASGDGEIVVGESMSASSSPYTEAFRWTEASGMIALGDLPGGRFESIANAISADGSTIVGMSSSGNSHTSDGYFEAFRWTITTGLVPLGDFPGGFFESRALGTSADGSLIVGSSIGSTGYRAFIWDTQYGMRDLAQVLTQEYGLDLSGWILSSASAVSSDGTTIVGTGYNPSGEVEAFRAVLPEPSSLTAIAVFLSSFVRSRRRLASSLSLRPNRRTRSIRIRKSYWEFRAALPSF
ncbi:MAG TPA: hypothetical protein VJZ71_16230 [Phycisphaerae bacterium]|nr:hypothetical protein [Phycisphaerae bacterium]